MTVTMKHTCNATKYCHDVRECVRANRRKNLSSICSSRVGSTGMLLLFLVFFTSIFATVTNAEVDFLNANEEAEESELPLPKDFFDSNSVVLITGAAGFLGSELAMALHRTYSPKRIVLVDSMSATSGDSNSSSSISGGRDDKHSKLLNLEYKRQRVFHVLQTLGMTGKFYRVDFRPSIPEYFDRGEVVPILNHIFSKHPDITHVVHLATEYDDDENDGKNGINQFAVPRTKDQIQAGMMEALLEQLRKIKRDQGEDAVPHFTYASSHEVYNTLNANGDSLNPPPFAEHKPITTPSSLRGASKLLDEILVDTYYQTQGIYAVGLRFFPIYGPWSSPRSILFQMAERAVMGKQQKKTGSILPNDATADTAFLVSKQDFVYIDDAVDAVMAAMQFRPLGDNPRPLVINVGTGKGTSLQTIAGLINQYFPNDNDEKKYEQEAQQTLPSSTSYASTTRAKNLLGFEARVPLEQGIINLLAWHYDRAFPYGGRTTTEASGRDQTIASQGIIKCPPYDTECLRGTAVFPCASECSHQVQCTPSFYDPVVFTTRQITAGCDVVLYTVALDNNLSVIPSAMAKVSTNSQSFVNVKNCNIAFVSSQSPLVTTTPRANKNEHQQHGFWTLVPLSTSTLSDDEFFLPLLPKLSPGLFFGEQTKRIIYVEPNVIVDSIPALLEEASMQPFMKNIQGATAMLIGKKQKNNISYNQIYNTGVYNEKETTTATTSNAFATTGLARKQTVQNAAYRTFRFTVIDEMSLWDNESNTQHMQQVLDSSFLVHTLKSEDSRLFRCDVFGELVQWEVGTDQSALEFIMGLHDMWSRVMALKAGHEPWWIGDKVETIPEATDEEGFEARQSRRLTDFLYEDNDNLNDKNVNDNDDADTIVDSANVHAANARDYEGAATVINLDHDRATEASPKQKTTLHLEASSGSLLGGGGSGNFGGDDNSNGIGGAADGANGNGIVGTNDGKNHDDGDTTPVLVTSAENDEDRDDKEDYDEMDDDSVHGDVDFDNNFLKRQKEQRHHIPPERDISAYDTWMGVLSSTAIRYFVRIVPSSEAGVVILEE